jgi:hypothetical protein
MSSKFKVGDRVQYNRGSHNKGTVLEVLSLDVRKGHEYRIKWDEFLDPQRGYWESLLMEPEVSTKTDQELADEYRAAIEVLHQNYKELRKRGFSLLSQVAVHQIEHTPIKKIVTTEVNL